MASRGSTSSANGLLPSGSSNNNININNNHHIHDDHDEEAGPGSVKSYSDDEISSYDPFDIPQTKNASLETLKRWRPGFEERFQKEASLCSSAVRPALGGLSERFQKETLVSFSFIISHVNRLLYRVIGFENSSLQGNVGVPDQQSPIGQRSSVASHQSENLEEF